MSRLTYASASDVGVVRKENQDSSGIIHIEGNSAGKEDSWVFVVADGMGGHAGGQEASRLAVKTIEKVCTSANGNVTAEVLRDAFQQANAAIYNYGLHNPLLSGMGTTCSALLVNGDDGTVVHIGDSRVYYIAGDEIQQVTLDHSKVAEMVRRGLITEQQAQVHPERSMLLRAMGVRSEVQVDMVEHIPLRSGATCVLCTDGLSNLVSAHEIMEIAINNPPETACARAVSLANARGGYDNITIQIIKIDQSQTPGS